MFASKISKICFCFLQSFLTSDVFTVNNVIYRFNCNTQTINCQITIIAALDRAAIKPLKIICSIYNAFRFVYNVIDGKAVKLEQLVRGSAPECHRYGVAVKSYVFMPAEDDAPPLPPALPLPNSAALFLISFGCASNNSIRHRSTLASIPRSLSACLP